MSNKLVSTLIVAFPWWRFVLLQGRSWSRAWQHRGFWTWGRTGRWKSISHLIPWWGTSTESRATHIITAPAVPTCVGLGTTTSATTNAPPPVIVSVCLVGREITAQNVSLFLYICHLIFFVRYCGFVGTGSSNVFRISRCAEMLRTFRATLWYPEGANSTSLPFRHITYRRPRIS
jgi:hypothetical protein